jgi:hypothetical protein
MLKTCKFIVRVIQFDVFARRVRKRGIHHKKTEDAIQTHAKIDDLGTKFVAKSIRNRANDAGVLQKRLGRALGSEMLENSLNRSRLWSHFDTSFTQKLEKCDWKR